MPQNVRRKKEPVSSQSTNFGIALLYHLFNKSFIVNQNCIIDLFYLTGSAKILSQLLQVGAKYNKD